MHFLYFSLIDDDTQTQKRLSRWHSWWWWLGRLPRKDIEVVDSVLTTIYVLIIFNILWQTCHILSAHRFHCYGMVQYGYHGTISWNKCKFTLFCIIWAPIWHGTVSFVHFKSLKAPPPPPLCQGHPAFRPSGTPSSRRSPSKPYLPDRNWQIQPMSMGKTYPYPIILVG